MRKFVWTLLASVATLSSSAKAATSDTARIIDEGMNRSHVMLTASELMDGIGPRLTNSTNMRRAEDWAIAKFQSYGLSNVHREAFDFGHITGAWCAAPGDELDQLASRLPKDKDIVTYCWGHD